MVLDKTNLRHVRV